MIYQDETSSSPTRCMSQEKSNSPLCCYEYLQVNIDEDSLDGEGLDTISDYTTTEVVWLSPERKTMVQVNGSVVTVPHADETETAKREDEKKAKDKLANRSHKTYSIDLSRSNKERISERRKSTLHNEVKNRFVCKLCDRLFKSLEWFRRHNATHDINYYATPGDEGLSVESYQCSGDSSFIDRPVIEEDYCDEEEFTCQVCDMIFATPRGLSKHMDVHRIPYIGTRIEERQESISEEGNAMIDLTD